MDDIKSKLLDVLKKSLPEMEITAFKEYINEAESNKEKIKELRTLKDVALDKIEELKVEIGKLEEQLEELSSYKWRQNEIKKNEEELYTRQLQFEFDKQIVDMRCSCEQEKVQLLREMLFTIFKNPGIKKRVSKVIESDEPVINSYGSTSLEKKAITETIEEEISED